jgi:acetyl esterase
VRSNLQGLPGATVVLAEIDPLRSEGEALAKRLKEAGSDVDYKIYDGVTHEFFGMGAVVGDAKSAEKFVAGGLKKAFGTNTLI